MSNIGKLIRYNNLPEKAFIILHESTDNTIIILDRWFTKGYGIIYKTDLVTWTIL